MATAKLSVMEKALSINKILFHVLKDNLEEKNVEEFKKDIEEAEEEIKERKNGHKS
tara:strand:+ start:73 stop:240 length:168 start_codon:yes stop_codon:yes gene_type:complete